MDISPYTKLIGLIGHPVKHSLSPKLHNILYQKYGLDCIYLAFDIAPKDIMSAVEGFRTLSFVGFNVTVPHKQAIIPFLDAIDPEADAIGAVNTVKIRNGKLIGYNTDGMGFVYSLEQSGFLLQDKDVVVLGAGGASKAICAYLLKEKVRNVYLWNRTKERALELISKIQPHYPNSCMEYIDNKKLQKTEVDLLVNTTSVGMWPEVDSCPLEEYVFSSNTLVADIIYNPLETHFLKEARKAGCITLNGLGMLVAQALKSIEIWTGIPMDYDTGLNIFSDG